jgi:hypothetical protein
MSACLPTAARVAHLTVTADGYRSVARDVDLFDGKAIEVVLVPE